jgi:hypothetical protein
MVGGGYGEGAAALIPKTAADRRRQSILSRRAQDVGNKRGQHRSVSSVSPLLPHPIRHSEHMLDRQGAIAELDDVNRRRSYQLIPSP